MCYAPNQPFIQHNITLITPNSYHLDILQSHVFSHLHSLDCECIRILSILNAISVQIRLTWQKFVKKFNLPFDAIHSLQHA